MARAAVRRDDPILRAGVRRTVDDQGVWLPLAVAAGLKQVAPLPDYLAETLRTLKTHASAKVRSASRAALGQHSDGVLVKNRER